MATWNDIADTAIRKLGGIASGGSATTAERTDAVAELNRMFGLWSAEMGPIFAETAESLTWASGQASRTIGAGGDLNTSRPEKLIAAWWRDGSGLDTPIEVISFREYQDIPDKTTTGATPLRVAYNPSFASSRGELFMYPTPSADITFRPLTLKPLDQISSATATVTLPSGYEDIIVANLVLRLAPEFGREPTQLQYNQAISGKRSIMAQNLKIQPPRMDVMTPGQGSRYNPWAYINR